MSALTCRPAANGKEKRVGENLPNKKCFWRPGPWKPAWRLGFSRLVEKSAPVPLVGVNTAETLASRNVWKTFNGQGVDLGGGAYGPNTAMVAEVLNSGGAIPQRLAAALKSGELELRYGKLPEGQSGRYMPGTGELTLNKNMNWSEKSGLYNAASTAVHEGQHWMDDVAGIDTRGMKNNEMYFEARAFLRCFVSCDHIPRRSMALFRAKAMLDELIAGLPPRSCHQFQSVR